MSSDRASRIPLTDVFPRYAERNLDPRQRLFGRLVRRILPRHVFEPLRFELHAARVRLGAGAVVRRYRGARDLLVNIGCGGLGHDGWVNVDLFAAPGVNCVYDCRKSLPFPDGSVRGIFSEHFFEHVDYTEEAPYFLAECRRVLAPGGVLRLVVPDLELYLRAYCGEGWDELARVRTLGPDRQDPYLRCRYRFRMELVNAVFRQAYQHKAGYDFENLAGLLALHGFRDVTRRAFGHSALTELCLDSADRAAESLYVEGTK